MASVNLAEAMEANGVKVLAESHCSSNNSFRVCFQHVCDHGMARGSWTAGTVRQPPCLEHGQNGQRPVFACRYWGNAISGAETSRQSPKREEAGCWVSGAWRGEGSSRKTCGPTSLKPYGRMPFWAKEHHKDYAAMLETQWNRCISTRLTQTADSGADATSCWNATSAPNTTSARDATSPQNISFAQNATSARNTTSARNATSALNATSVRNSTPTWNATHHTR